MVKDHSDSEKGNPLPPYRLLLREREIKKMYLTMHSTHFIYGNMASDHSDSERGNPLPPHRLLLSINSKGSFICTISHT